MTGPRLPAGTLCAVDGCPRGVKARGWCDLHWKRWRKHGDPLLTWHAPTPAERLWAKVDRSGGPDACWPFTGSRNRLRGGYGELIVDGTRMGAHRLAVIVTTGPIDDGLVVCHRCDNPPCCNPAHLFVGTQADNISDMWAKGRGSPPPVGVRFKSRRAA